MGDGGVACVPLQHIMDKILISDTLCSGKVGNFNPKMKSKLKSGKEVENGEEVEEGEFGSLVENGEFVQLVKPRKLEIKSEIEKGEFVVEKWRKGRVEKVDEFVSGKWRKGEVEKGEFSSGRLWSDEGNGAEKGEFISDRWGKTDDISYSKMRRHDSPRDKGWKSGKYFGEKEFTRSGSQQMKRSARWETNPRFSSNFEEEEGYLKNEPRNGKSHGRNYSSGNRLKRHGADSDNWDHDSDNWDRDRDRDRKHQGEFGEYTNSKSRRISDEYSEERSNRYSFPSRNISSDRYSSRPHESSLSSRVVYEKYNNSPRHSERSPRDRARYDDYQDQSPLRRDRSPYDWGRDRSPYDWGRDRSPYDRSRNYDHRNRSPSHSDRSPQDQARYQDRRDRTPNFLEPSPLKRGRPIKWETNRKSGANEKHQSHHERKGQEEKFNQREANERDPICSAKEPEDRRSLDNEPIDPENNVNHQPLKEDQSSSTRSDCKESPQVNGTAEELLSMEEDMDICDTPPHVPVVANSTNGKWFYLDHIGVEQGPSRLCDLKVLVEEGFLVSDHLVKHLDIDRWVTVENAVSPVVTANFPSIVSDAVTELVNPPEAPGNLLADIGDVQSGDQIGEEMLATSPEPVGDNFAASETFHIDERVGTLLEGFTITPGNELEAVGEVLQMTFEHGEWEQWDNFEGFIIHQPCTGDRHDQRAGEEFPTHSDFESKETFDTDWFPGGWSCKGGDWKRNDEDFQDKSKRKFVINDGYPLCQMPKSGHEDPRWHRKDELYYPSHSRRLDLPSWAFSSQEDSGDCKTKPLGIRGVKGTMLPVIRINTCVVKDHGSFISEPRVKVRGKERHSSRSTRPYSANSDAKRSSEEGSSYSKKMRQHDSHDSWKSITSISIPKDRLCTADDLQLHLGDWYYLDGVGHEQGPLLYPELQVLADQGIIQKHTSVFRKFDKVWVPVTSAAEASEPAGKIQGENNASTSTVSSSFHSLHPQFIGYARGKLHELVMKSYKSREFAAAINEVLDPWINARQPRNEIEKHIYNPAANNRSDHFRAGKKARLLVDGSEEEYDMEEDVPTIHKDEYSFDDLCGDTTFCEEDDTVSEIEAGIWGQLDGKVLARVFHFLRADLKSLVYAALTCKHWRSVIKFYKDISRQADFSSVAHNCTDSMISNIVNGYNKEKITSLVLLGCANITPVILEEIIRLLPSLSCIDIRGCSQFEDLSYKFPSINWVKSRGLHSKVRSLTPITGRTSSVFKTYNGLDGKADDSSGLRDYLESLDKRDTNQLFRRSLYKRSKLFDAKRSSSILSRSAHLRHLSFKKSRTGYKRMEEFLSSSLKDIMKENTFGFFVPKVAQIEDRMKNGYYAGHGLSSIKEDISRMCRAAIKAKNRGDAGDMNHIITLFIRLAMNLEGISKSSHERDEMTKTWKENSPPGFGSGFSRYKRLNKVMERKYTSRSNGSFGNGGSDYRDYASDREIRRHLSKLNKKSMGSGSEASDRSSEETQTDSPSTSSDTESDSDSQRRDGAPESRGDAYFTADDGLDSQADNREWGARMTKASLVPPVTRKYEVIDHYVVVADEEEVQRKMRVSLPEDYAEKLNSQKNGTEESDMEIPEVKDYKPRKQLGDEVIEQEVYGIDPYTHNLLLDSMPGESDWSLLDKHLFIEDVLLPSLNRQVRDFTGTRNTPMMYPLRPVIEGIIKTAEEDRDTRTVKLCQFILNTIDSRPEDSYVAYRKGLGVVCNKEGGFGDDDFVVEFLGEVYPAWKWFEKQDGIRYLQKNSKEPAPEFYNIYLERPKGDADGYDLVVVDAMHKANYASRICHSCRPNCEAKVTAVDGQYQIGIYTVRPIGYGEEVTFDYNSVTESKEEYEASVCLCGSQVCRGSYLNLTGDGAFQKVLKECHGILDRHHLMLEACEFDSVSDEDYIDLGRAGLGSCLLGGLPHWLIAYSARLVRFINFERTKLPDEILRHNLEEKRKYFADICLDVERNDAEVQAEGVYNQRLQNLALTLDKVRYVMRCVFDDPKEAPPPLEKLTPEEAVSFIWKGDGSLVDELIQCMSPHMEDTILNDLKSNIRAHDPSGSGDIQRELRKSLLWLRDEVRKLPCTYKCRHDAAADLIHIYAYTKYLFRIREYKPVTSPPVYISPLDLGPNYSEKLGSGFHEYSKTYGENYCLGQLIYWHNQTNGEPDCSLARASKGCLSLPDFGSFYAKVQKPSRQRVYGPRTVKFMLAKMEKQPQRPWPRDRIWSFESSPKVFGSPMLDAVLRKAPLDKEMVHWLKHRPPIFQAVWDR